MPGIRGRIIAPLAAAGALLLGAEARGQSGSFSTQSIVVGTGGYILNFSVIWTCDDDPAATVGAPGEVDLVDGSGNLVGTVTATGSGTSPQVSASGAGSISSANCSVHLQGASGSPADGLLHASWDITGPAAGSYSLRFWTFERSVHGNPASEITTETMASGGGGTVNAPTPTPTPSPTPPPSPPTVSVTAPAAAAAFQAAQLSASAAAGTHPLASVSIAVSMDNGSTWTQAALDTSPTSPSDLESAAYTPGQAGSAIVRAVATDTSGLSATATQPFGVGRAAQGPVIITPQSASATAGQSVPFSASGGATGNYSWGGSATGGGPSQVAAFPSPGSFAVTVFDAGNANYLPSAAAAATVSVQPPFYTLTATALAGGGVSGGGSYPVNAVASALATPAAGFWFSGWTGDVTSPSAQVSVVMSSSKSITAHFSALLAQTISFTPPGPVTTRSPPVTLSVSASSGLPVSLALNSGPATLSGAVVAPTGAPGVVSLTATQPGNGQYMPAAPLPISITVGLPPAGVLTTDDSAATKRSDKTVHPTSYTSNPPR